MEDLWRQLIESWRSENLPIQNACKEDDIRLFEARYKIALPLDMREYFLHVNGMIPNGPGYQDKDGFSCWSLETMIALVEENEELDRRYLRLAEEDSLFLFCDYMDWSWAYAIKMIPGSSVAEGIYLICCRNPIRIADSFSDFVRLYLGDPDQLYPPATHEHA